VAESLSANRWSVQWLSVRNCQHSTHIRHLVLGARETVRKVVRNRLERHPAHAFVLIDVVDQALVHEQDLWTTADIWVNSHSEHGIVVFPIHPIKLIAPQLLNRAWVDKTMAVGSFFDEHHGWEIIQIPVRRDLNETCLVPPYQRVHPGLGGPGVVDFRPVVAHAHIIRMKVVVHQAMVVLEAILQEEFIGDIGKFPPGRNIACRTTPRHPFDETDTSTEDLFFLLWGHGNRVLMRIPVRAYFVSSLDHHTHLLRKSFERMPGDKPRRLEVVLVKEFQQARCANLTCKEAAGNVVRGIFPAIGPEPSRHGIDIDAIGHLNFFLCHNCSSCLRASRRGLLRLVPPPSARPRHAMWGETRQSRAAESLRPRRQTHCQGRDQPALRRSAAWRGPGYRARLRPGKIDKMPPGAILAGHETHLRAARRLGLYPADIAPPDF